VKFLYKKLLLGISKGLSFEVVPSGDTSDVLDCGDDNEESHKDLKLV
jgi:hypothetical protein